MLFPNKAPSGMEMVLASILGADGMAAIKQMASAGTLQKIVAFADGLDEIKAKLDRIEGALNEQRTGRDAEPCAGDGAGGRIEPSAELPPLAFEPPGPD